jgi:poly-beta-1,6-N-acetyl-D-glucosamine synthase
MLGCIVGILLFIVFGSYIWLILSYSKGWDRMPLVDSSKRGCVKLSCVIPFRNEKENLALLIKGLEKQNLTMDQFEVLLIDDQSTDDSRKILLDLIVDLPNFFLFENEGCGKKDAIASGIKQAKYLFIVTTDADCYHPENWLSSISSFLSYNEVDLLIAPVQLSPLKGWFNRFQAVDFMSLVMSGAGACGIGKPIMCNAANLVYKKELYQRASKQMPEKYASGDDIFLLQYAVGEHAKIRFLKCKEAIVSTFPLTKIIEFFNQRVRWAAKSKGYTDMYTLWVAWIVFITNLILVISPLLLFFFPLAGCAVVIGGLLKAIIDFSLLRRGSTFFDVPLSLRKFVVIQFIYPLYIFTTVVYAAAGVSYWKGRRI